MLGGPGADTVEAIASQAVGSRDRRSRCLWLEWLAPWFVDRLQPYPVRGCVDQQMMFAQGCYQRRDPVGSNARVGGHGIHGLGVPAPVQAFRDGDLGVAESVQDDSGVGVQAQLE